MNPHGTSSFQDELPSETLNPIDEFLSEESPPSATPGTALNHQQAHAPMTRWSAPVRFAAVCLTAGALASAGVIGYRLRPPRTTTGHAAATLTPIESTRPQNGEQDTSAGNGVLGATTAEPQRRFAREAAPSPAPNRRNSPRALTRTRERTLRVGSSAVTPPPTQVVVTSAPTQADTITPQTAAPALSDRFVLVPEPSARDGFAEKQSDTEPTIHATAPVASRATVSAAASDPDGDVLTYHWTASAGSFANATVPETQFQCPSTPGDVTLTIRISDPYGGTASDTITIHCIAPNR